MSGPAPSLPILWSFRRCPYAMRARLAIAASGIACELREIVLRNKPHAFLAASPKGTVPVVQLPDGRVIDESLDVMVWALSQNDPEGWLDGDKHTGDALIARNDGAFKHHLDRYKYATRYEDAEAEDHRAAGFVILRDLDQRLSAHPHLLGEAECLADIAIFPFVRQFAHTDFAWFQAQDIPHLRAWLDRHLSHARFAQIMEKFSPWTNGDTPLVFCPQTYNKACLAAQSGSVGV